MSYRNDPIYQTIQWLRSSKPIDVSGSFATAFASVWRDWARIDPLDIRVQVGLVNYKPFERARIMVTITLVPGRKGSQPVQLSLFLLVLPDSRSARHQFAASAALLQLGGYGPPIFQIADQRIVGWTLPNAPNLHDLQALCDSVSFRRFLAGSPALAPVAAQADGPRLVRYVPLKRALLTWTHPVDGTEYYLKLIDGAAAATAALNLRELHAWSLDRETGFDVPEPVHYSPELHTIIMREVPGRPFTEMMSAGRAAPFAEVGKALAGLHKLPTTPLTTWSAEREMGDLRRHLVGAKRALPRLKDRLSRLEDELAASLPDQTHLAPIHGNLFGDQILYEESEHDRRVGIVDWDSWALGDPHFDLGRLIAHFLYVARLQGLESSCVGSCIDAFLQGYADAGAGPVDRAVLNWHISAALLLRAKISSLRKLRPGWTRHFELMIEEAERVTRPRPPVRPNAWRGLDHHTSGKVPPL